MLTFGELKTIGAFLRVAANCPSASNFTSLVNDGTRQLMRRGSWWGTVQPMQGCVHDGCIVWPRMVDAVLALNICHRPLYLANHWFQFMQWDSTCDGMYRDFKNRRRPWISDTDGTLPVYRPIPNGLCLTLRLYIDNPNDAGKTVTLFGIDNNGQTVITTRPDGTTQEGIVLTLAVPFVQTPFCFQHLNRVLKSTTLGNVRLYAVDANGVQLDMAVYSPSETSPQYIRNRIRGFERSHFPNTCVTTPNTNCRLAQIQALVSLSFVPVVNDQDLVLIENVDALAMMVQSIKYREQGDPSNAANYERMAFRELNYELRNRFPDEQVILNFRPFGNDALTNSRTNIGMI
jgi:hypothetical protein